MQTKGCPYINIFHYIQASLHTLALFVLRQFSCTLIIPKKKSEKQKSVFAVLGNRLTTGQLSPSVTAAEMFTADPKVQAAYASPSSFRCAFLRVINRLFQNLTDAGKRRRKYFSTRAIAF